MDLLSLIDFTTTGRRLKNQRDDLFILMSCKSRALLAQRLTDGDYNLGNDKCVETAATNLCPRSPKLF